MALARDNRRYEVGREAYKSATIALRLGTEIVHQEAGAPTPDDMAKIVLQFLGPIRDARIAFALPVNQEVVEDLLDAIFAVPIAIEKNENVESAQNRAMATLRNHEKELVDAWRDVLHGGANRPDE